MEAIRVRKSNQPKHFILHAIYESQWNRKLQNAAFGWGAMSSGINI
jgi:hypothetical protein